MSLCCRSTKDILCIYIFLSAFVFPVLCILKLRPYRLLRFVVTLKVICSVVESDFQFNAQLIAQDQNQICLRKQSDVEEKVLYKGSIKEPIQN